MQEQEVARSAPDYTIYTYICQTVGTSTSRRVNEQIHLDVDEKIVIIKASCHQSAVTIYQSRVT